MKDGEFYTPSDLSTAEVHARVAPPRPYKPEIYLKRILSRWSRNGRGVPQELYDQLRTYCRIKKLKPRTWTEGEAAFNACFPRTIQHSLTKQRSIKDMINSNAGVCAWRRQDERPYAYKPALVASVIGGCLPAVSPRLRDDLHTLISRVADIWQTHGLSERFTRPYSYAIRHLKYKADRSVFVDWLPHSSLERPTRTGRAAPKRRTKRAVSMPNYNATIIQLLYILVEEYESTEGCYTYAVQCTMLAHALRKNNVSIVADYFTSVWTGIALWHNEHLVESHELLSKPWHPFAVWEFPVYRNDD